MSYSNQEKHLIRYIVNFFNKEPVNPTLYPEIDILIKYYLGNKTKDFEILSETLFFDKIKLEGDEQGIILQYRFKDTKKWKDVRFNPEKLHP